MTRLTQEYLKRLEEYAMKYRELAKAEDEFWNHAENSKLLQPEGKAGSLIGMMNARIKQYTITNDLEFIALANRCYNAARNLEEKYNLI